MNKTTITYFLMALIIIGAFGYMAYGEENNGGDDKVQAIQESLARLNLHNNMSLKFCNDEAILKEDDAFKRKAYADKCFNEKKADDMDLKRQLKELTNSGTLMTGSTVIPPSKLAEDRSLSIECELGVRDRKVEGIEFHYTDTVGSTLAAIKRGHEGKFGIDHIGYHYVIKENGEITSTRDERCIAAADKWSSNNYRLIQIAFVGNDKPTKEQTKSMVELTRDIQKRYSLPTDSVSAHREWGPKSDKESLKYWYGSKEKFIELLNPITKLDKGLTKLDRLLREGQELESVNYAWNKWKDMDFILTIDQESRWNPDAVGDVDHPKVGDYAYGYCQYNSAWHKDKIAYYKSLPTWKEKIDWCHERYIEAMDRKGGIGGTFHGYNARLKNKSKYSFQ